jgi:hypothetical protein
MKPSRTNKFLCCSLLLAFALAGCASRSKARAQAQAAFAAGQQQAMAQMADAQRTNIRVLGNVLRPEIPWADGLTLAQAIVAAQCQDRGTPRQIMLIRQRERILVDPKMLLGGEDFALIPGDTIEIHP